MQKRILCHLKMIFCRVLLPVLWVLAKATCSWGSHFSFQWCCFTGWDKWNDGSIPGCLTWLLNLFWEMNRRATPVRNTSAGRPLCFMEPRVLLHRFYQNRFSIWNFCNVAFFHISTISMLTLETESELFWSLSPETCSQHLRNLGNACTWTWTLVPKRQKMEIF